jgi:hypothetical protein
VAYFELCASEQIMFLVFPTGALEEAAAMAEYRAYLIGADGHFIGFEPLFCADDSEAIEKAMRLMDRLDVEIWNGERFIIRLTPERK